MYLVIQYTVVYWVMDLSCSNLPGLFKISNFLYDLKILVGVVFLTFPIYTHSVCTATLLCTVM